MKTRIKDVLNIENAIRIYRERPLALLSLSFVVLSLYSILNLFMLTEDHVEKKQLEEDVLVGREAEQKRLLSLKRKAVVLEERAGVVPLSRGGAALPFSSALANETRALSLPETPPEVRVKALGAKSFIRVALIDIDGEESKLMREQDTFGTIGRILRIDNEGVTWLWGSKEFRSLIWE